MQIVNFLEALAGNVRFIIFRSYPFSGHKSMHTGVTIHEINYRPAVKLKYIILLIVIIGCSTITQKKELGSEYVISSSVESEKRAEQVLSLTGSEDVSSMLILRVDQPDATDENKEYFADELFDWIITLEPEKGTYFSRNLIQEHFSNEWRSKNNYPILYAIPCKLEKWTFFQSSESNDTSLLKLALAWKLYESLKDPPTIYTEEQLSQIEESVKSNSKNLKVSSISYNYSTVEAASMSRKLADFILTNNYFSSIVLQSDSIIDGKEIWDIMMSVGLKWGDMDLFHWNNPNIDYGDDQLFSVWTLSLIHI